MIGFDASNTKWKDLFSLQLSILISNSNIGKVVKVIDN